MSSSSVARNVDDGLVHHSDHGSRYRSIGYTNRLAEISNQSPIGTFGDSYDNALAETIHGRYSNDTPRVMAKALGPHRMH